MPLPTLEAAAAVTESVIPILGIADDEVASSTLIEAAPSVARLHVATRELVASRAAIDSLFARQMSRLASGSRDQYVGDGYVIRRRGGTARRTWNDEALWPVVAAKIHEQCGSVTAREDRVVEDTLRLVREVLNTTGRNMRSRKLREWGINPDLYCESTPGMFSLEVI